jgi:hypothetical protein
MGRGGNNKTENKIQAGHFICIDLMPHAMVSSEGWEFYRFSKRAGSKAGVTEMRKEAMSGRVDLRLALFSGLILIILLAFFALKYKGNSPDLESVVSRIAKKSETVSRMRINLLKSADTEKGAVMADTDQLSRTLADQSLEAAAAVERDRLELSSLIEHDALDSERNLLKEFDNCWAQFQRIDKVLLEFAVENTNIKAASLSFNQGIRALERFENSLMDLVGDNASSIQHFQIVSAVSAALVAGLKIQYLHAPHIAAANDEEMDRIEQEMRASQQIVSDSLNKLAQLIPETAQPTLRMAASAYAEFKAVTSQVVKLSRQNSNIKSFELSLGRKRKVTAECDEILTSLQAAIRNRAFEATK